MKDVLIIGGGAAGLTAAIAAADADPSASILLLEGLDRVGKKLLATGNGKCNLTNRHITPSAYHTGHPEQLSRMLEQMPTDRTLDFFAALGLETMEDDAGRIYPYARQASMVLDLLLLALRRRVNIEVRCGCKVTALERNRQGFTVLAGKERFSAARVILTTGGRAAPKQGSDGSGYPLLTSLGHHCTPLRPALVPLRCQGGFFKTLKGLRVLCEAGLWRGGHPVTRKRGEVQFTEYGVSGIPIFQISCLLREKDEIGLDLVPEQTFQQLRADLHARQRRHPKEGVEDALLGLLPKRLQFVLLRQAGMDPAQPIGTVERRQLDRLASLYKQWRFPLLGTQGWEQAQVTLGGVPLKEIGEDCASKQVPGLYLAGEVMDVTGDCGGYNLHWAWCTGMIAGQAAVKYRRNV